MATNKLRISVVIPVYNEERGIRACLDSLVAQTQKPYEIIVVDNNCTDKTIEIVKQYKTVKIVKEKNQGTIFARNTGYKAVSGEIIARLDGDSVLGLDWIDIVTKFFLDNPSAIGCTGPLYSIGLPLKALHPKMHRLSYFLPAKIIYGYEPFFGCSMAFRTNLLELLWKYGKDDNAKIHEDLDTALAFSEVGRVHYMEELKVGVFFGIITKSLLKKSFRLIAFWRYRPLPPRTNKRQL
jgi:glycosyltransferase involved in cell wall biosynthesis